MNCACPDLCGGCPAMGIPTAIPSDFNAPVVKVPGGTQGEHLSADNSAAVWKTPRIEFDSGLFTVRAATQTIHRAGVAQQSGLRASPVQVRLGDGGWPSFEMRPQPPCVPLRILLPPRAFMRGGDVSKS